MNAILMAIAPPVNEEIRSTLKDFLPRDPGILILTGALLLVSLGIFIWAAFFRKPPSRPHYKFRPPHSERDGRIAEPWKLHHFFSRRHRRRRREQRRNPTLAEAGGLPPVRSEDRPPTST